MFPRRKSKPIMSRVMIPDTELKECVADDAATGKAAISTKVGSQQQELESRAGMTGESHEF